MSNKKPHLDPPPCKLLEKRFDLVRLAAVHDEDSPVVKGTQRLVDGFHLLVYSFVENFIHTSGKDGGDETPLGGEKSITLVVFCLRFSAGCCFILQAFPSSLLSFPYKKWCSLPLILKIKKCGRLVHAERCTNQACCESEQKMSLRFSIFIQLANKGLF